MHPAAHLRKHARMPSVCKQIDLHGALSMAEDHPTHPEHPDHPTHPDHPDQHHPYDADDEPATPPVIPPPVIT